MGVGAGGIDRHVDRPGMALLVGTGADGQNDGQNGHHIQDSAHYPCSPVARRSLSLRRLGNGTASIAGDTAAVLCPAFAPCTMRSISSGTKISASYSMHHALPTCFTMTPTTRSTNARPRSANTRPLPNTVRDDWMKYSSGIATNASANGRGKPRILRPAVGLFILHDASTGAATPALPSDC